MTIELLAVFFLLLSVGGCKSREGVTPTRGELTVLASESLAPVIREEADAFMSIYPEGKISVVGVDTREAIVALLNDSVSFIATDREFNAEERAVVDRSRLNIEELYIARDGLAVLVQKDNPLEEISLETLGAILRGEIKTWEELPSSRLMGAIEIVTTGKNSGTYELLKDSFFGLEGGIPAFASVSTQPEVEDYVSRHPEAIGFVSTACLKDDTSQPTEAEGPRWVRALAFTGVDSTGQRTSYGFFQAYIHLGKYPLNYPVLLYYDDERSALAAGFSAFVASAPGQKIILDWGLVPVTMPVRLVQLN